MAATNRLIDRARVDNVSNLEELLRPPADKETYDVDAMIVPIERVHLNPRNSRTQFDEDTINDIAGSMQDESIGQMQALTVRRRRFDSDERPEYEVIAGDTRLLAAQRAGKTHVRVVLRNVTDLDARRINLMENLQRSALNDADAGAGIQALQEDMQQRLEKAVNELFPYGEGKPLNNAQLERLRENWEGAPRWYTFALDLAAETKRWPRVTQKVLSADLGYSVARIQQLVAAADLPEAAKTEVANKAISSRAARALTALAGNEKAQNRLVREIKSKKLSGDDAMARARELAGRAPVPLKASGPAATLRTASELIGGVASKLKTDMPGAADQEEIKSAVRILKQHIVAIEKRLGA